MVARVILKVRPTIDRGLCHFLPNNTSNQERYHPLFIKYIRSNNFGIISAFGDNIE